ncbi:MAG: membrane protein [Candidatus Parcubacteria bacterium]|nr:MAG: membrane protein [Candidatus Parcubacteria bacterium]
MGEGEITKIIWIIFALLSAISAALVAIFGKIGVSHIDSTLATTIRAIVMALFLIVVSLSLGKFQLLKTIDNKALTFIILAGISGALSWLFYFFALKLGPASGVAALDRLSVVFVLIFSILFLAEKLTLKSALGAIFITIGAILMIIK